MAALFSERDQTEFERRGILLAEAERQIEFLKKPPPHRKLEGPCLVGDGIRVLQSSEVEALVLKGRQAASLGRVSRFVPASGAASRMFKVLTEYQKKSHLKLEEGAPSAAVTEFFKRLEDFAFFEDLDAVCRGKLSVWRQDFDFEKILKALLGPEGLQYSKLPKALLKFHRSPAGDKTALEEQMVEAALSTAGEKTCRLHFTVSPEHRAAFKKLAESMSVDDLSFELSYSGQKDFTDTLALDTHGKPFRRPDGSLLFRPGGHGALLNNLEDFGGDLVQVKNIDNISGQKLREENVRWKLALTGLLFELQTKAHRLAKSLAANAADGAALGQARQLLEYDFYVKNVPVDAAAVLHLLDRPMRVCGMVKNQGEPGGGPYWVSDVEGRVSAQIVEMAEMDLDDHAQKHRVSQATHFNPVDLVLGLRDYHGQPYDLQTYRDDSAVFIANKTFEGHDLRALERPGLWNGSMQGWLTLFVQVPLTTFNPVKMVNDLLRPGHQP